jgi:hypothetical protein
MWHITFDFRLAIWLYVWVQFVVRDSRYLVEVMDDAVDGIENWAVGVVFPATVLVHQMVHGTVGEGLRRKGVSKRVVHKTMNALLTSPQNSFPGAHGPLRQPPVTLKLWSGLVAPAATAAKSTSEYFISNRSVSGWVGLGTKCRVGRSRHRGSATRALSRCANQAHALLAYRASRWGATPARGCRFRPGLPCKGIPAACTPLAGPGRQRAG